MSTEIRCKKCSHILVRFDEVPTNIIWYSRLIYKLKDQCPNCGHNLPDVSTYAEKMQFEVQSKTSILVNELCLQRSSA